MFVMTALLLAGNVAATVEAGARSPAQLVCALTGDCAGRPGGERPRRPREASFDATGIAAASLETQYARIRAARLRASAVSASAGR